MQISKKRDRGTAGFCLSLKGGPLHRCNAKKKRAGTIRSYVNADISAHLTIPNGCAALTASLRIPAIHEGSGREFS